MTSIQAVDPESIVSAAARTLRQEILSRADDDMFLGSEDDLVARLGVSPPTFRQAARLLEFEELIFVKRGVGGGYFGRKPSASVVARLAGTFLKSQGAPFKDVIRAQALLEGEVIRLLIEERSAQDRRTLAESLDLENDFAPDVSVARGVRAINHFWSRAGELSGSISIALFTLASQAYGATSDQLRLTPARIQTYGQGLAEFCRAIEDCDLERALAIRAASYRHFMHWLDEDSRIEEPLGGDNVRRGQST